MVHRAAGCLPAADRARAPGLTPAERPAIAVPDPVTAERPAIADPDPVTAARGGPEQWDLVTHRPPLAATAIGAWPTVPAC